MYSDDGAACTEFSPKKNFVERERERKKELRTSANYGLAYYLDTHEYGHHSLEQW